MITAFTVAEHRTERYKRVQQIMVKKFISTAARQRVNSQGYYEAVDSPRLQYEVENSYPILAPINGYVEEGDEVELIIVRMLPNDEVGAAIALENSRSMGEHARELCRQKGACLREIHDLVVPDDEGLDTQLNIFESLISMVKTGDRIFVDLTFGTKTQMLAQTLAINYAYQAVPGATVECVVYGNLNFQTGKKRIYDVTALFLMDQIVNRIAAIHLPDPAGAIRMIIGNNTDAEEEE